MQLKTIIEIEKRICDLQAELEVVCADIAEVDRQAAALLEEQVSLSTNEIRDGARQSIRQRRNEIINRLDDLSLIQESIKTEIEQLEKQKNIILLLESLTPEVEKYKVARGTYLSTFEKIQDQVNKYHKLGSEIKALVTEFNLCQQTHPINLLLSISIKADEAGIDYSSLVNNGDAGVSELGKFTLLQVDAKLNELQEVVKALESFTQTVCLNEFYVKPFFREREEPILQSGKISSGMQGTVDRSNYKRFEGPGVKKDSQLDQAAA